MNTVVAVEMLPAMVRKKLLRPDADASSLGGIPDSNIWFRGRKKNATPRPCRNRGMANWPKLAVSFRVAVQKMAQPKTMNAKLTASRRFKRFIFLPTRGAATSVSRPTGATAKPDQVAVYPTVVCSHSGKMMLTPENAK